MMPPPHKTVILGGGAGGLASAYYLLHKEKTAAPVILEASHRLGGWIRSRKTASGTIFEQGPHTLRTKGKAGANTLEMVEELRLENNIISISQMHPAARNRMIYANGQLHKLPSSIGSMLAKQAPFSKSLVRLMSKDLFAKRKVSVNNDESIYDFTNRRFGQEVADYLISALICGICAGNAKEISVKFIMKPLFDMEQKHGSITRGVLANLLHKSEQKSTQSRLQRKAREEKWSIYSFKDGLETLPNALQEYVTMRGTEINLNSQCETVTFNKNSVSLNVGSKTIEANHLISAIPAFKLSKLMEQQHPELSQLLKTIKPVSVGVVNLEYNGKLIKDEGFGFLVPPKENIPILGVIYDSCCFPNGDKTVFTVMMGGYWFNERFGLNPSKSLLYDTAVGQLQNILCICDPPTACHVNILYDAIPQYTVCHNRRVEVINEYIAEHKLPLSLCGASYHGVGVNDVIISAKNVVDKLYQH